MNIKINFMKPSTLSNCKPGNNEHLMCDTNGDFESDNECNSSSPLSISSLSSIEVFPIANEPILMLKDCSNAYLLGYLGKKVCR